MIRFLLNFILSFFILREMRTSEGELYLRQYRFLKTPWFSIYLHQICKSDEDQHLHNHVSDFYQILLSGEIIETYRLVPSPLTYREYYFPGEVVKRKANDLHRIRLTSEKAWILILSFKKIQEWGYETENGFISHNEYRQLNKNYIERIYK